MAEHRYLYQHFQAADIRWIAIVFSVLFSLVIIAGNPVPNDDAFSYLKAAELFAQDGLDATLSTYGWYGYSVLISLTASALGIGMINAAHLLNVLSYALLVYVFITLVMEYRQSESARFFAAVVILCFPSVNEMRYYLIRDFAFWAFSLAALVQLIRFNGDGKMQHALGWLLTMAVAIFFRLEGLLILVLSPFALLVHGNLRPFLTLLGMLAGGAVVIMTLFLLAGINLVDVFSFAYRWYLPLLADYPATLAGAASGENLSIHISGQVEMFTGKGLLVLFTGYLFSVIANIFMTLGPPVSLFLLYGFFTGRQRLPAASKWPWIFFLGSSMIALLIFVSILQFLTTRYAVMVALLLLSLVPLAIDDHFRQAQLFGTLAKFRTVFVVAIIYFAVDSLVSFGYSKQYVLDAAEWSGDNIPGDSTLLTNSFPVAYYSGLVADFDMIRPDPTETLTLLLEEPTAWEFLAMDVASDESELLDRLAQNNGVQELERFNNERGDAVIIYRIGTPR